MTDSHALAISFVPQYYKKWTQTPSVLHKFYSTAATFKHATTYTLDVLDSVLGSDAIKSWMSKNPVSVKFDLDRGTIDAMKLPHDSHLIVVTGYLALGDGEEEDGKKGEDWRTFSQTFVLGKDNPDSKQWKVVSDCLRIGKGEDDIEEEREEEEEEGEEVKEGSKGKGEQEVKEGGKGKGGDDKGEDKKQEGRKEEEGQGKEETTTTTTKVEEEGTVKEGKSEEGGSNRKKNSRRGKKRGEEEKKELASKDAFTGFTEASAADAETTGGAQEEKEEVGKVVQPSTWANLFAGGDEGGKHNNNNNSNAAKAKAAAGKGGRGGKENNGKPSTSSNGGGAGQDKGQRNVGGGGGGGGGSKRGDGFSGFSKEGKQGTGGATTQGGGGGDGFSKGVQPPPENSIYIRNLPPANNPSEIAKVEKAIENLLKKECGTDLGCIVGVEVAGTRKFAFVNFVDGPKGRKEVEGIIKIVQNWSAGDINNEQHIIDGGLSPVAIERRTGGGGGGKEGGKKGGERRKEKGRKEEGKKRKNHNGRGRKKENK
ncbi:hypothetical protein TrCOL_g6868 [Triparma columacea]|uniref:NTF2 domain-containing protein n=1 Tax=Triparma columacea TaxID=722753 RepID=A0A9W7GIH0_9STRA|nr:hypothetical protein TrCOL_g6868 [Triparma columacea]